MIDLFDLFDIHQQGQIGALTALQANTDQRVTKHAEAVVDLERRYEHLRLLAMAMWKLLKDRTGATDADLRECIEHIDLLDGKKDGKVTRHHELRLLRSTHSEDGDRVCVLRSQKSSGRFFSLHMRG